MGDIIPVPLSNGKPVQLLPLYNFPDKFEIYKKQSFSLDKNILKHLSEISIYVDSTINLSKLISFLQSLPGSPTFNLIGNIWAIEKHRSLLSFFDQHPAPKNLLCSYTHINPADESFKNNFSYKISVDFPIDAQQWDRSRQMLLEQTWPVEYIFNVSSEEDYQQAVQMIERFHIENHQLTPVYTGNNINFFKENIFLSQEDILSSSLSIKDLFTHQSVNTFDFGKITVLPIGDVYANINHPPLGNIATHSIHEMLYKEMNEGKSWFRIRNQAPCVDCIYQWLCPSPSNYEMAIGRPNLCHVK
jgi:pseudo-rSAM protein